MVRRATRFFDLMDRLDYDHPDDPPGDRFGRVRWKKTVPKKAMVEIAEKLGLNTDGTKPELRNRIMTEVLGREPNKSSNSKWSTSDLFRVIRALSEAQRLDAEEVNIWDKIPKWAGKLTIVTEDGEYDVEVVDKGKASWKDSWDDPPNYSEYELYKLAGRHFEDGRRHRLMVLRDLDYDQCRYRGSVVLEKQVDFGPYQRWKKQSYVQEVTVRDDA